MENKIDYILHAFKKDFDFYKNPLIPEPRKRTVNIPELTEREAARLLSISPSVLRRAVSSKTVNIERTKRGKQYFYKAKDVRKFKSYPTLFLL